MRPIMFAWIAMLCPAVALAAPNQDQDQSNTQQQQPQGDTEFESETFGSTGRGQLGVVIMGLTPDLRTYFGAPKDAGLLVAHVDRHSPAARAGVRVGDVITKIGDSEVKSPMDAFDMLTRDMAQSQTVSSLPIEVVRDHNTVDLQVNLKSRGDQNSQRQQNGQSI